jgi:hypothetical protein
MGTVCSATGVAERQYSIGSANFRWIVTKSVSRGRDSHYLAMQSLKTTPTRLIFCRLLPGARYLL